MVLPVVAYGHPVLRKQCAAISKDYPHLDELIKNMWETMYFTNGIGLAAPQVNAPIRLFIVDTEQLKKNEDEIEEEFNGEGIKAVFINAEIIEQSGKEWKFNEGCLSIPKIREDIMRNEKIKIRYYNEKFEIQERDFDGISARVILHEYDHIEGKLFIDYISPLKRKMLKGKLNDISKGKAKVDYRMLLP